jgi:type I restriction enzyme S subunit
MTPEQFFENFGYIADAPNGVKKLRELILQLAVRGKLVPQDPSDEPASKLLERITIEKELLFKDKKIKKNSAFPSIDATEQPYGLPKSWIWSRLGSISSKIIDGSHNPPPERSNGVPMLSSQNVLDGSITLLPARFISEEAYQKEIERTDVTPGDVFLTIVATIGRSSVVPDGIPPIALQRSVALIRTLIDPNYLSYFLRSPIAFNYYDKEAKGTAQRGMYLGKLSLMQVPIPPLSEQNRIVAKIYQLLTLCDELEAKRDKTQKKLARLNNSFIEQLLTTQEHTEFYNVWEHIRDNFDLLYVTPENIGKFRLAILQLAVLGKLVPQDPNDEPASKLFERIQAEKARLVQEKKMKKIEPLPPISSDETPYKLPHGWKWCRVWDIAKLITSGSRDWAKHYSDSGAIFVTMGNLSRDSYQLRMDSIRYVNPPDNGEGSRTKLEENDLLISITGDVGNLGLIPANFGDAYINQHTCLLRFMPACQNRYFPELMKSPIAKLQFNAPQRGIKNSFRLGDVGEMIIPLPPLAEQHRIIVKVDLLMTLCDKLETRLTKAQTKADKLATASIRGLISV